MGHGLELGTTNGPVRVPGFNAREIVWVKKEVLA